MKTMVKKQIRMLFYVLFSFFFISAAAQEAGQAQKSRKNPVKSSAGKLSKTLEEDKPDEEVAAGYTALARELAGKEEYARAEDYLERALKIYLRLKRNSDAATACRELAKAQEAQRKTAEAVRNYTRAAQLADGLQRELNLNDAGRLANLSDPARQSAHIQKNIELLETADGQEEKAVAHRQMAQVKMEMNDREGAVDELKSALKEVESEPEAFKIKQEIANTLTADKQYEDAITLNESLLAEARQTADPADVIAQLQNLSRTYFEANHPSGGFRALREAYGMALREQQTLAAKKVVEQLAKRYRAVHRTTEALDIYADFIARLDTLVRNDSTLIDDRSFRLQEDRILRLEKERQLKDELIARKNNYNQVLSASMILILAALAVISRILASNLRKNKRIALQSLRREMNPHFIFNSLNSVNQFIAQNRELEANKYLASYSRLMRTVMENSNRDFIPLRTELEQMEEYLALEQQRFQDKFTCRIDVDEALDADRILIPNMLIQPQLENAIWHGLRYRETQGLLSLTVCLEGKWICVTIEDDGIGLEQSHALKTEHQKAHRSRGMNNTRERIDLLNSLYHVRIAIDVAGKKGDQSGVKVRLRFPLMYKKG
jgi:hypothetical protein